MTFASSLAPGRSPDSEEQLWRGRATEGRFQGADKEKGGEPARLLPQS